LRGLGLDVYGSEGIGKTSWALEFDQIGKVVFCSVRESGVQDLLDYGRPRPDVTHFDIEDWEDLVKVTESVREGTFVVDSLSGLQAILFDYVCRTLYKGIWEGKEGFTSFYRGQRVDSPKVLEPYLTTLDNLRNRGVNVVLLGHMKNVETPNTQGADYKTHTIDMDDNVRASVIKWAQAVLFMNIGVNIAIATEVDKTQVVVGKAKDVDERFMYTTKSPGHVAKNRDLFTTPVIRMGNSPKQAFLNFYKALPDAYRKSWPLKESTVSK
jgi:hypothetical protein